MAKEEMKDNSSGIAGVVLGIVAIGLTGIGQFSGIVGCIMGIVGLFFSLNQKKHAKNKWSKYGFVLNVIAIVLEVVSVLFGIFYLSKHPELLANYAGAA